MTSEPTTAELVGRLEYHAHLLARTGNGGGGAPEVMMNAASRLEQLQAVVDRLAAWSEKYPKGGHYPSRMQKEVEGELYAIEATAREAAEKARES